MLVIVLTSDVQQLPRLKHDVAILANVMVLAFSTVVPVSSDRPNFAAILSPGHTYPPKKKDG